VILTQIISELAQFVAYYVQLLWPHRVSTHRSDTTGTSLVCAIREVLSGGFGDRQIKSERVLSYRLVEAQA